MDSGLKAAMSPSLALLTLNALTPQRHKVTIVNENVARLDLDCHADLVALTVTVDVFDRAVAIARCFRRRGIPVVAGGIHISAAPDSAVPFFDAICIGRAETTWQPLLEDVENGRLQRCYRDDPSNGTPISSPDYHIADSKRYIYPNVVTTSRGCPFRCDFCYNSAAGSTPYMRRPIADVLKDIESVSRRHILFIDDNFIGNPEYTIRLLRQLTPYHLKWSAAVSANVVKRPDILDLMADSGCQSLFVGLETLRQPSLVAVHKTQNVPDQYATLVSELHHRGIMVNASIVFGLPGDGPGVFEATLAWMVKHKVETVTAHILTPYPGTVLHARMAAQGRIIDHDLSHYDTAHVVFQPDSMTPQQLQAGYQRFYRQLYSFRNILARLPDEPSRRRAYLLFTLGYRKFGRPTSALSRIVPLSWLGSLAARIAYR